LDELAQWGMQKLAEAVDTSFATHLGASKVYLVFNPLSFTRDALVELTQEPPLRGWQAYGPDGEPLLGQWSEEARRMLVRVNDLPPLGWTAVALVDGEITASGGVRAEGMVLQNDLLRAELDPQTGHLLSVVHKASGAEAIEPGRPANVIQLYRERRNIYPAWNLDYDKYGSQPQTVDNALSITVIEPGPVRTRIRIARSFEELYIEQDVILDAGADHLRFETRIDNWGEVENRLAKVAFPLNLENAPAEAIYDIPYGTLVRRHDENPPYNYEALGHKWVAILDSVAATPGRGVALLSRNKYGFDILNDRNAAGIHGGRANILRLTLLKAAQSPRLGNILANRGGPIGDRGSFTAIYGLRPFSGDWAAARMPQAGWSFNMQPPVVSTDSHGGALDPAGSWAIVEPDNVLISALKRPWDGPDSRSVVLRLHEVQGADTTVRLSLPGRRILSAEPLDLIERAVDGPSVTIDRSGACSLLLPAHSLATLLLRTQPLGARDDDDDSQDQDERGCGCN
ncbi:MAG: glycoside hydrolase family 38 C-terminal domain-containing protein, partial [Candidatus Alcyoniella australis]|nr:glycoside hydrolase family 38 C-terminal domain-containing protein [Candidatus Alcyoniella australis]